MKNINDTKIFALGGLGEVGKNMYCFMTGNEIIITDVGITFPSDRLPGIDYVIPDFTFLKKNEKKIKALFITHGHEDHIGGIPFLLQTVNIPNIYCPNQALGLIRKKLNERGIGYKNLHVFDEKTKVKFKTMTVEFFRTTHSIPDSHGIIIYTPNGTIVTTGDFKFDLTPIGPMANLHKMAAVGEKGVSLLLSDSTNAVNEGMSRSESKVDAALSHIFDQQKGRIIIATFASNIYRLKHIVDTCKRNNRKIAVFGRSMENNLEISLESGYIKHKEIFVTPDEANRLPNDEVCLLCTGSQGEPLAALSRIANGSHKQIKLKDDDIVIFSSSAIPGNALSISKTINKLYLRGVKEYTNSIHSDLAVMCDIPRENTFILSNGEVLSLYKGKINKDKNVQAGDIYVEGNRIGETKNAVMRERQIMSQDGIVIVIANIDTKEKKLININLNSRGFVLIHENIDLLKEIENEAKSIINNRLKKNCIFNDIKSDILTNLSIFIHEKTGRYPIIVPIMNDVKKITSKE